ncbi:MAG: response regulator, partial [Thermodesulfovibrionales bacterium]|nr:response regulator [Thermodesulfovibrionales bacterium]
FTTKKTGSGLGLSTTYTVIKNHEGHIFVESSDKGTEFTIYLPILSDENIDTFTSQNESKKPSTVQTKLTKGKILVLEDKEDVSSVMRDMFEVFGYETAVFTIGEDLISTYKQHLQANDKIDFVILDLTIPGAMGGIETMQRLKQIDPNVKAFISTGYDAEQALKENKKYGFIGCISKPFKIDDIKAVLSQI